MAAGNNVVTKTQSQLEARRGETRDGVAWGVVWARGNNGLDKKENKPAAH